MRRLQARHHRENERGAALVEFAILAPLLILLVLGIVEFGWIFGQFNDVRHAAREGARFAAVNGGTSADIASRVCVATDGFNAGFESLDVALDNGGGAKGSLAEIVVTADIGSLTSAPIITTFTPDSLASDVTFRLERDVTWTTTTIVGAC
jgi:Flp pilus assembly protein TadG